jgi:hypothetical protein
MDAGGGAARGRATFCRLVVVIEGRVRKVESIVEGFILIPTGAFVGAAVRAT